MSRIREQAQAAKQRGQRNGQHQEPREVEGQTDVFEALAELDQAHAEQRERR